MKQPVFPTISGVRFADIPGHPGYAASDDGRVWSCRWNRWGYANIWRELSPANNGRHGRQVIALGRSSGPRYVHHLVLEAFIGPKPDDMECLHINGTASDNRLANLRWGTRAENFNDMRLHGKRKGELHALAKLTADDIRDIRRRAAQGETQQSIADRLSVKREAVGKIIRRERWAHIP